MRIVLLAAALAVAALPARAQRARTVSVTAGAAFPARWLDVEGPDAIGVGTALAPRIGVDVAWPRASGLALVAGLRAAFAGARGDGYDLAGDYGGVATVDALVGVERGLGRRGAGVGARASLRAAAGASFVAGPDDLAPWETGGAAAFALDLSGALRLGASRWALAAGAHALRYGAPSSGSTSGEAGFVVRPWLEVRRAL